MDNLLSGLIGAIVATILNIFYNHISNYKNLRIELALEIVSYFDEVCRYLQIVYADKINPANKCVHDCFLIERELLVLLNQNKNEIKISIIYGDSSLINTMYCKLKVSCFEAYLLLLEFNKGDLNEQNKILSNQLNKKIPANRKELEIQLIKGNQIIQIIKTSFRKK